MNAKVSSAIEACDYLCEPLLRNNGRRKLRYYEDPAIGRADAIAIHEAVHGEAVEWLEKVSDDEYTH